MTKELRFDRARFDAGEMPVRTRNGMKVLWCAATKLSDQDGPPIVAVLDNNAGSYSFDKYGRWIGNAGSLDLVHEPRTVKVTVVLCRSHRGNIYFTTDAQVIADARQDGLVLGEHTFEIEEE